jgi:hypothetical protein
VTTAEGTEQLTPAGARRMYQRVLAGWAMDLLALRRAGLDRPGRRGTVLCGAAVAEPRACGVPGAARGPRWNALPDR